MPLLADCKRAIKRLQMPLLADCKQDKENMERR
jgi:hypothetical protein